jgi:hypothetical protein
MTKRHGQIDIAYSMYVTRFGNFPLFNTNLQHNQRLKFVTFQMRLSGRIRVSLSPSPVRGHQRVRRREPPPQPVRKRKERVHSL